MIFFKVCWSNLLQIFLRYILQNSYRIFFKMLTIFHWPSKQSCFIRREGRTLIDNNSKFVDLEVNKGSLECCLSLFSKNHIFILCILFKVFFFFFSFQIFFNFLASFVSSEDYQTLTNFLRSYKKSVMSLKSYLQTRALFHFHFLNHFLPNPFPTNVFWMCFKCS